MCSQHWLFFIVISQNMEICLLVLKIQNLASFDQFSNLVLLETVERRIVRLRDQGDAAQCFYFDLPLGTFMVRGDSMVLMGAVDDAPWLFPVSSMDEFAELEKKGEPAIEWDFDGDLIA